MDNIGKIDMKRVDEIVNDWRKNLPDFNQTGKELQGKTLEEFVLGWGMTVEEYKSLFI